MIEFTGVTKTYRGGTEALRGVDLRVERGEIFSVIGRSGAGKSTLVRCVNLLERPTSGTVRVDGVDLLTLSSSALRAQRRRIGMIFQNFALLSSRTVRQNVALPLKLAGIEKRERDARVDELLAFVGLSEYADRYPAQLSGGQQQRVGIARALVIRPSVLLCDEATSALDPETTLQILALLKEVRERFGITILVITHAMGVVRRIADRVAVLDAGRIVEMGTVQHVFAQPQHPVTRAFLRAEFFEDLDERTLEPAG